MSATNRQLTLEDVSEHVRAHIGEWLAEQSLAKPPAVYEIELRERMIRVEEELKNQRELMKRGFDLMEKRFEAVDKRFEAVDKRFEAVDKRFESMSAENNKRFEELTKRIDRLILWSFGIAMGTGSLVVATLKLLP
uniref:DUF1640 domain-containing protein n=1 Tax=Candidatus Kentrum sp. SD TaxID=2126332 RepID=A0A450YKB9_9GAMM|nr:MAG: hypothetical protein BECKSD772F_GA0070984_100825 [Candidatus Kentron sp. SD]VFK41997.1 MAG: hypothetical protein BECKSD772E_GA0070983_10136 [Candidatus Kentron sp. SD]VFK78117.1 MAG: hypothetical protein BECKSD772D_GA0070982_100724 [Candidatus Kentron sp. SD]